MELNELAQVTGGTLRNRDHSHRRFEGVSIDSRAIVSGQLFIALPGQRVDGHDYITQALDRGAIAAVVERGSSRLGAVSADAPLIFVEKSHDAMIRLAERYRDQVDARRVGITGSNGKTTTKEIAYSLIHAVEANTFRSPGNLNNLYGAPLALFAMPGATKVAVLEMGVSLPGEMAKLAAIVKPHLVAITNVSATHLEFLGSIEGVAREKLSLLDQSGPGTQLVINADDELLVREARRVRSDFVTFGIHNRASFKPDSVQFGQDGGTIVTIEGHPFRLALFGEHQVYNLLAGYSLFRTLGLSFSGVDTLNIEFKSAAMRGQIFQSHGVTFVVDCYNSNPASVTLGLKSFAAYVSTGRKIVILGDMLELGADGVKYHREMGRLAALGRYSAIVFVGPLSREAFQSALDAGRSSTDTFHFPDARACARETAALFQEGDTVYLKGSRGIGLEAIVEPWQVKEETV